MTGTFDQAPRSLRQYLAELIERLEAMPLDDPRRSEIATRIREVEAEIAARRDAS